MTAATEKRREEFAERVARSLESGIVPWQKKEIPNVPVQSAVSGRNYNGLNAMYLMEKCAENGYKDPRFITASDANKNGLYVKKGEHGVVLEHWSANKEGKIAPRGYVVFNAEQIDGKLPEKEMPEAGKPNLEQAAEMLRKAGIEIKPGSGVKEYQDAVKSLTVKNALEFGLAQTVHTTELLALRCSIASTLAMKEAGIPVDQPEGAPMKSWANSIRRDPSQLSKAARDGSVLAGAVLEEMGKSREAELFRAGQERAEAHKGQEIVSEAASIPRGQDFNLPNADLSGVQEAVIAASDKAAAQVNDLRASASAKEANAHEIGNGIDKFAAARNIAKRELGDKAIVTNAAPGKTYSGKIIGLLGGMTSPDMGAIQAISDNHAVIHDIKNISANANLKLGEEAILSVDEQGYSAVKGRDAETKSHKREQSREGVKR